MNRIILGMAGTNYVLVAITMYLGLLSEPTADPTHLTEDYFRYHFLMGLFTALFTMLVHCMVFTYFLGTNRWVKEATVAYSLDGVLLAESRRLRGRAFATAMVSMLLVVATIATGAGAHTRTWPTWLHQVVPATTYLFMFVAYWIEIHAIEQHIQLTDRVMDEVQSRRRK
ncbi:MAG: hypothetical protein U1D30_13260 [Planctomycetota bacterium]